MGSHCPHLPYPPPTPHPPPPHRSGRGFPHPCGERETGAPGDRTRGGYGSLVPLPLPTPGLGGDGGWGAS